MVIPYFYSVTSTLLPSYVNPIAMVIPYFYSVTSTLLPCYVNPIAMVIPYFYSLYIQPVSITGATQV